MPVIDSHHRLHVVGPTAKSYIQDGLVAMWDGIENAGTGEHSTAIEDFVELISGNTAVVGNFTGIGELAPYTIDDTGIRSHSTAWTQLVGVGIPYLDQPTNWTLELAYTVHAKNAYANKYGALGPPIYNLVPYEANKNNRHAVFGVQNGSNYHYRFFYSGQGDTAEPYISLGLNIFSMARKNGQIDPEAPSKDSQKRIFHNGTFEYKNYGSSLSRSASTTYRQFISGGHDVTLHSFRIYNRPLSKEEQSFNSEIDKARFPITANKPFVFPENKIYIPVIYRPGFTYRLVCENSYTGKHFYCTSVLDGERVYSTWEIASGSQYATINNNGKVDIVSGTSNQTITVKCSYSYQGETLERTKDITISYDNELKIECADTLVGTSGNAIARYNDEIVTPSWSIVGTGATIDANGAITITASGTVEIHATYSKQTASKTVNLDYVANKSSTTTVDENGSVTTTTTETIVNQDGSTTDTSTSVTVHDDGSVSNTTSETTTQEDGSSTTTSTTTNQDGTSSQTEIQGNADGSSTSTTNEYNADGDMTKTINGEIDTSGNESTQNIEYDDEGTATVTGYAIDTSGNEDGTKNFNTDGVNTEFYGFDAVDGFEMDLHFKFDFTNQPSGQNENHHQILCMKRANPSPWYGFQIRQTGTNKTIILGTQFATGSNMNTNLPISWVETNKIAEFNIHITYNPTLASNTFVATDLIGGTTIFRSSNKFPDLPELRYLTVCLGYALDENGNPYRYSNVDILNFNLVKIANA